MSGNETLNREFDVNYEENNTLVYAGEGGPTKVEKDAQESLERFTKVAMDAQTSSSESDLTNVSSQGFMNPVVAGYKPKQGDHSSSVADTSLGAYWNSTIQRKRDIASQW